MKPLTYISVDDDHPPLLPLWVELGLLLDLLQGVLVWPVHKRLFKQNKYMYTRRTHSFKQNDSNNTKNFNNQYS